MPLKSGFDLANNIRDKFKKDTNKVNIVLLSGDNHDRNIGNFDCVVRKPINIKDLKTIVDKYINDND